MPRRSLLPSAFRASLLAVPTAEDDRIRYYSLSESDLSVIRQRRGAHNRLGFAVQLCAFRYPGTLLPHGEPPAESLLRAVADQLRVSPGLWAKYSEREKTRREHLQELQSWLGLTLFGLEHHRAVVSALAELATQTDQGVLLAQAMVEMLRHQKVIVPAIEVIERVCAEALTQGTRRVYTALTARLSGPEKERLDSLLDPREGTRLSTLTWMRQPPGSASAKNVLHHLERLQAVHGLALPEGLTAGVHQNRWMKLAREGGQMTGQHLRDLETRRRQATLVAVVLDTRATLIDETIELHERMLGSLFSRAKRRHAEEFQQAGRSINEKVRLYSRIGRALVEARSQGGDPFAAIEEVLPWDHFTASIEEAEKLAQPEGFDFLPLIGDGYQQLRRYVPALLSTLEFRAAPAAADILQAVEVLRSMNERQARKVPEDAPIGFVRKRWADLVFTDEGIDRRFYELCVLSALKNALRSGDLWIPGSRQFKDFEEYLIPAPQFQAQLVQRELGLAIETECEAYLEERLLGLERAMERVETLAAQDELPDASLRDNRLKLAPLSNTVPEEAEQLMRRAYALIPHVKITDLLLEVDQWTGFTRHFTHLKSNAPAEDKKLLLTAMLADGVNLGLSKMAESCPGTTYAKLSWLQAWHIREETYRGALAELVNAQGRHPFAGWWGDGTTSSSDGQRFRAGGRGEAAGQVNARYGNDAGVLFYTHVSDQYAPFHTQVINATVRDATYVLDGLLYHEADLKIEEHYTDTAGFTDHVFGLMHLLGFRFAPRIRDLADRRLYITGSPKRYPTLTPLIGGTVNVEHIRMHWDEVLRLASSIRQGTVTASLMLRKLGSYPRQNGLAIALRELGRIERTLFTLEWLQNTELRRRVHVGLNKGEARNALARAVFFNRLGELRDRSFEDQRHRASGLNLVVAAIVLWNTVYLERAVHALAAHGHMVDEDLLQHLSPLGWDHIALTGDYTWKAHRSVERGQFRALRPLTSA
ncbi:MAG TPA: Tn3 family transposase [Longimicrobiaceae bacterium]|nr:Tn3 family transposase [Longimicrobiaceae bacterium]